MSNVPKLRFKEFGGEWKKMNGNLLFETITNKKHNSDLPVLAITQEHGAIPRDMIDFKISVSDASVATYKVVEIGDFIISLRSFQGGIEHSKYKGICSPAYIILRPMIELDDSFYKHYFKTVNYIKELNRHLEGIRDGKMVSYKQFSEIKLPLPSKQEQEKIALFLTSVDTKIEQLIKKETLLTSYKKGVMQKIFNQEIRFKADDGSEFCDWEEKKLGDLCKFQQGYQVPSSEQVKTKLDGYKRYLYISDFFSDNNITYVKYREGMNLMTKDDIAVANTGNTAGSFYKGREGVLSNNMFFITILSKLTPEFLYVFLESSKYEKQLNQFFNSGGQPHLGHKNMSMIGIEYPCTEEQIKIANFLSSIDSKIEQVQKQLNLTKEFKKALLQQMFV